MHIIIRTIMNAEIGSNDITFMPLLYLAKFSVKSPNFGSRLFSYSSLTFYLFQSTHYVKFLIQNINIFQSTHLHITYHFIYYASY
jgi:hypothetical protein